jgi:sortase A
VPDRRLVDDLTIGELEQVLRIKKREARLKRLEHFASAGRRRADVLSPEDSASQPGGPQVPHASFLAGGLRWQERTLRDKLLLAIEVAAALGLVAVLIFAATTVQELNQQSAQAQAGSQSELPVASPTPLISVAVLPGGHTSPNSPGGAQPNYDEVPGYLRPVVELQFSGPITLPTPGPGLARRIVIQAIGVDAPVVQGDGWEQLKQGIAQHIGTANPGQQGNMVVSAHNDIFGEIFRHLDQLKEGDELTVQTLTGQFTYQVVYTRIVSPDTVSVMDSTSEPVLTLISCYPYLVDNQRIVVVAKLAQSS